jgi:hypothetical protein
LTTILITYDGIDISNDVLYSSATFETQLNAVPGTCSFKVHDPNQTYSFITGKEIRVFIDDVPMWGGYLRRFGMTYPFSADDTSDPGTYTKRIWHLEGADYNVLFDSMVGRHTGSYSSHMPDATGYPQSTMDGWALWKLLHSFSDFPSGFDITADRADATNIDDITTVLPATSDAKFHYIQQGTKLRDQFESLAKMAGAVFYIGAEKSVHWHAYENVQKRWGFSDDPNSVPLTVSPDSYQDSDWPFQEVTGEEDGTLITNDVIVWGGSPIGSNGTVLVARYQDEVDDLTSTSTTYLQHGNVVANSSIDLHGRWQLGETHFEGRGYGVLAGPKARANTILNGSPGAAGDGLLKGLRYPQWTFSFSWWAHKVPMLSGVHDHIRAGDIVKVSLAAFGVAQFVPCRTVRVSFQGLDPNGDPYVLLSGDFSLSYTDPIAMWKGVIGAANNAGIVGITQVTTVDNTSTVSDYGSSAIALTPLEAPDGIRTLFTIVFPYIYGTLDVRYNGLVQRPGADFTETDPAAGTFTCTTAPASTDIITVYCRTLAT